MKVIKQHFKRYMILYVIVLCLASAMCTIWYFNHQINKIDQQIEGWNQ